MTDINLNPQPRARENEADLLNITIGRYCEKCEQRGPQRILKKGTKLILLCKVCGSLSEIPIVLQVIILKDLSEHMTESIRYLQETYDTLPN